MNSKSRIGFIWVFFVVIFIMAAPSHAFFIGDGSTIANPADGQGETLSIPLQIANACPCDSNHGQYVSCVAKEVKKFVDEGLITKDDATAYITEAAKDSTCGKKEKN